jgi:signal transduction histidine kinase
MLRYNVHPRVLHIPGDRHFLQRMMINLVSNALRFTASGSTVSMRAYPAPGDEYVILAVEDMGPGVPPEDRKRIFQPFEQGKGESSRGTGLGLAICQEVAHAHGGRIWVEDNEPRGSRFCVMLPAHPLDEADGDS